ncbi:MAG: hypothetical protein P1V97_22005, partial [Planctomycetota bacterium]|nr:hypothetical protein [Planctomycetota bacterium]
LGAILYESLTGTPVFAQEASFYNSIIKIIKDPVEAPKSRNSDCPAALNRICMKALQKDKNARFQSVAEFKEALEDWLENPSESRGGALRYWLVSGLVALMVLVGLTYFLGIRVEAKPPTKKKAPSIKAPPEKGPPKKAPPEKAPSKGRAPSAFQGHIFTEYPWVSPVFFDANGDGCDDIITVIKEKKTGPAHGLITAFDGHTGERLWQDSRLVSSWAGPCLFKDGTSWRIAAAGIHERNLRMFVFEAKTGKELAERIISVPPGPLNGKEPGWPLAVETWEMGPQRDRLFVCYRAGTKETSEPATVYFWNQTKGQTLAMTASEFDTKSRVLTKTGREIFPWWSEALQRHIGFLWVCNGALIGVQLDDIVPKESVRLVWSNPPLTRVQKGQVRRALTRAYLLPVPGDRSRLLVVWYSHKSAPTVIQLVTTAGDVLWTQPFSKAYPTGENPRWLKLNDRGDFCLGLFERARERAGGPSQLRLIDPKTGEIERTLDFEDRLSTMTTWIGGGRSFVGLSSKTKALRLLRLDNFEDLLVVDKKPGDALSNLVVHDLDRDGRPELILSRPSLVKGLRNSIEILTPKLP